MVVISIGDVKVTRIAKMRWAGCACLGDVIGRVYL